MPFWSGKKDTQAATVDTGPLEAFAAALPADAAGSRHGSEWTERNSRDLLGRDVPLLTAFLAGGAPDSVGGGALRFLTRDSDPSIVRWNGRNGWRSDWPSVEPGVVFASDWRGRLYILATKRKQPNGEPPIALLDSTSGEYTLLEYAFGEFLEALVADWRNLLEIGRFDAWRARGGLVPAFDQCVVPKVPLVLGGSDEVDELEVSSLVVAVSFGGQIWEQVKNLPPGAKITGVSIQ